MKPFNLTDWLVGKPSVTRDGRKAVFAGMNVDSKDYPFRAKEINSNRWWVITPLGKQFLGAPASKNDLIGMAEENTPNAGLTNLLKALTISRVSFNEWGK